MTRPYSVVATDRMVAYTALSAARTVTPAGVDRLPDRDPPAHRG